MKRNLKHHETNTQKCLFPPWLWQSSNLETTADKTLMLCVFVNSVSWLSVSLSAQCHSRRQRAQASEIQRPESMELWKNWWKTTSRALRGTRERGGMWRGPAEHQHPTSSPAAATTAAALCPVPSYLSDEKKMPPELQQPSRYRSDWLPRNHFQAERQSQNAQRPRSKLPCTHISLANERTQQRTEKQGYGQLVLNSPTSNCKVKLLFTGQQKQHSLSACDNLHVKANPLPDMVELP